MSDVGLAAVAAVVFFGGVLYLLNRFNESEIRRDMRKRVRSMLEKSLTDLVVQGDTIGGTHDGVTIWVEGGWTPGTRTDSVVYTTSAQVIGGRLAPFTLESVAAEAVVRERLAREGLETATLARQVAFLAGGSVSTNGAKVEATTNKIYALVNAVAAVAEIARAPERALAQIADAARVERSRMKDGALRLGHEARPVTVTIDRGVRVSIDAPPLEGLTTGSIDAAIESLGDHVRVPELEALSSELLGRIEIGEGVSFTLPLATPPDHVLRAVELVDRLTETERGPFR